MGSQTSSGLCTYRCDVQECNRFGNVAEAVSHFRNVSRLYGVSCRVSFPLGRQNRRAHKLKYNGLFYHANVVAYGVRCSFPSCCWSTAVLPLTLLVGFLFNAVYTRHDTPVLARWEISLPRHQLCDARWALWRHSWFCTSFESDLASRKFQTEISVLSKRMGVGGSGGRW